MVTEQTVKGLRVLETHPVESPLSTKDKPMFFKRIDRLVLEFDNEVYVCKECGHFDESIGKVRSHLSNQHPSKDVLNRRERKRREKEKLQEIAVESFPSAEVARPEPEEPSSERSVMDYTISEVLGMATENRDLRKENEELTCSRDKWKERALDSEKSLKKIRKALG